MKVSDILASLRARMRDDNAEFTKQGDSYLMSLIYFWQNQILSEYAQNIKKIEVELKDSDELELPFEIMRVCAVYLGSERVALSSHLQAVQLGQGAMPLRVFEKNPQIYGFTRKVSGTCTLYAVKKAFITSKDDEMTLNDDFINLLVLSVFLDLLKAQISPDNTQRIDFFEQRVLMSEKQRVNALLNRKNSPDSFRSPFVRV